MSCLFSKISLPVKSVEFMHEKVPFLCEYWPFMLTAAVCLLAAVVLFKTALEPPVEESLPPEPGGKRLSI